MEKENSNIVKGNLFELPFSQCFINNEKAGIYMNLEYIIDNYKVNNIKGKRDIDIKDIKNDSRKIEKGDMFIAEEGYTVDGHDYVDEAMKRGAIAFVVEKDISLSDDVTVIQVEDSVEAMAKFSSNFYDKPWEKFSMIGITGTNGKTSTTYLLKSILKENGDKVGIIGTNGALIEEEEVNIDNTTPNSLVIHGILDEMNENNIDKCIMEVSSHALDLNRVKYMSFDVGVFTNISKDHLDYHETIENYFLAKKKLFFMTKKHNIINIDDKYGKRLVEEIKSNVPIITYGIVEKSDIFASNIKHGLSSIDFTLNTPSGKIDIKLNTPGEFSVYNALAAAAVAYAYNTPLSNIKKGLEALKGVRGRFEVVPTGKDYTVIIDFAHTADGLEKVLKVIDEFARGRKIVVFGAGGNRDKTKRPEMGETVGRHADLSIVTSDNPRNEDPEMIIDDVIEGTKKSGGDYVKIIDRKDAIIYALNKAEKGDIILLAGKGHEAYTIINNEKFEFDERQIVIDYLKSK